MSRFARTGALSMFVAVSLLVTPLGVHTAVANDGSNQGIATIGTVEPLVEVGSGSAAENQANLRAKLASPALGRAILPSSGELSMLGIRSTFGAQSAVYLPAAGGVSARYFVASTNLGIIQVIDANTGSAASALPLFVGTTDIVASPGATAASGKLYISRLRSGGNSSVGDVLEYDLATDKVTKVLPLPDSTATPSGPRQPGAITYVGNTDGSAGTVFVTVNRDKAIYGIDVATGNTVLTAPVPWQSGNYGRVGGLAPGGDATATSGSLLAIDTGMSGQLARIDIATGNKLETRFIGANYQVSASASPADYARTRQLTLISGTRAGDEVVLFPNAVKNNQTTTYNFASPSPVKTYPNYPNYPVGDGRFITAATYIPGSTPGSGKIASFDSIGSINVLEEANPSVRAMRYEGPGFLGKGVGLLPSAPGSLEGEVFVYDQLTSNYRKYHSQAGSFISERLLRTNTLGIGTLDDGSFIMGETDRVSVVNLSGDLAWNAPGVRGDVIGRVPGTSRVIAVDQASNSVTLISETGTVLLTQQLSFVPGGAVGGTLNGADVIFVTDPNNWKIQVLRADNGSVIKTLDVDSRSGKPTFIDRFSNGLLAMVGVSDDTDSLSIVDPQGNIPVAITDIGYFNGGLRVVQNASGSLSRVYFVDGIIGAGFLDFNTISIQTEALLSGRVNEEYRDEIFVSGTPLPTLTVTGLPEGLSVDLKTGKITGKPKKAGKSTVIVKASNGVAPDVSKSYELEILEDPAVLNAPKLIDGPLDGAMLGTAYTVDLGAGGTPTPEFKVTKGKLPSELKLDTATGKLTGTPDESGEFTFTVTAKNTHGEVSREYTLAVGELPSFTTARTLPTAELNVKYAEKQLGVSGFPAPQLTQTGKLPKGMSFDTTTGMLSGTPEESPSF